MKRIIILAVVLLACLFIVPTFAQTSSERDGNWWREQSKDFKYAYVVGIFDGLEVGYDFSYLDFGESPEDKACLSKVEASFNKHRVRYLKNVTNGQVVDGLNELYSDYKNRRIKIRAAFFLVLQSIAGLSKDELQKEIELQRREASN